MIDTVIIFSIKRGKARQDFCKEHLLKAGVPEASILTWNGVDHQDFWDKSDLSRFFKIPVDANYVEMSPKSCIAQSLSYLDVLLYLQEHEKTGLIIFDDHAIYERQYSEINEKLSVEIPEDFYMVSISKPLMFETRENYDHLKHNKKTWGWLPLLGRVTMNGLQTPSESGLILSPAGATFLADLFIECATQPHFIQARTTTFELTLDHQMARINAEFAHRVYSFSHGYLKLVHYEEPVENLISNEER